MTEYKFPFKTQDFDIIYTNIAEVLKVKYPQNGDSIQNWYRKLLYELLFYVQSQFEPIEKEDNINPKNKNNKKKDNAPQPNIVEPIFSENIERALEIIYQDSDFAIYLLSWFLPILINLTDTFNIFISVDNSDTPAENVNIWNINLFIEQGMFKVSVLINGIDITNLTETQYNSFLIDPFLGPLIKSISFFQLQEYINFKKNIITYDGCDPQLWSFRLSRFLWDIKTLLTPFYINSIVFKTNLEPEITTTLEKVNNNKQKGNRKRFNEQKYLASQTLTQNQMTSKIIRTLIVSTFRTYYDFDEETISTELFDYLFKNKPLSY